MSTINNLIRFNWVSIGLFLILFTTKLSANCEPVTIFPFTEDFEGAEFPPPCWTSYDGDGDGTRWERSEVEKYNGLASAQHRWGNCNVAQEGWLVTPPLSIPTTGNYVLKFWSYNLFPRDYFYNGVWISTEENDPTSSTFIELKQLNSSEVSEFWKEIIIPLSDYAGQTIYIGFKYEGFCADAWYIDDVEVSLQDIAILTSGLDGGLVGNEYSQTLDVFTLCDSPIVWSITDGTLPDGLDLSADGVISGIPTNTGLFVFTVTAANDEGNHSKELFINIGLELITLTELLASTTNVIDYSLGMEFTASGHTNNYVKGDESLGFRLDNRNYYAVAYKITLSAENIIQIYSSIEEGDSYLILYKANGEEYQYVTHDNDGGEDKDSFINITVDHSGDYYIVLTDFGFEKSGNYSLSVTVLVTYAVTYDLNGGFGTTPTETNKLAGATFAAASTNNIIAPQEKRFKEWNTAQDESGTSYAAGATVTMPDTDLTLYAIWEIPLYHVNVINGEGSGNYTFGETVYITAGVPPAYLNLKFKNWSTTSPGVIFADANNESTSFTMPENDVTVRPVFEEIKSNIEISDAHFVCVYPNPTEGLFTLQFETEGEYNVTINDLSGKLVLRQTVSGLSIQMDIISYPAGVYLLTVDNGKQQSTKRVVKK